MCHLSIREHPGVDSGTHRMVRPWPYPSASRQAKGPCPEPVDRSCLTVVGYVIRPLAQAPIRDMCCEFGTAQRSGQPRFRLRSVGFVK